MEAKEELFEEKIMGLKSQLIFTEGELGKKERELLKQEKELLKQERELLRQKGKLERNGNELKNKEIELQLHKNELKSIYASRGMKILKKYYKLKTVVSSVERNRKKIGNMLDKGIVKSLNIFERVRNDKGKLDNSNNTTIGVGTEAEINLKKARIIIDIIIPIYNSYDYTVKCINKVFENTDVRYNLILINDCSSDQRISDYLYKLEVKDNFQELEKLIVIENEENLGFIKSINKGILSSSNDVVILNTDIEVPPRWLSELIMPYLENQKSSIITPFSDSAFICSFPELCKEDIFQKNLSNQEIVEMSNKHAILTPIKIPRGVDFCMFISRESIRKIGVFDESVSDNDSKDDWFRRAEKSGYNNIAIDKLLIYNECNCNNEGEWDNPMEHQAREYLVESNCKSVDYDTGLQLYIRNNSKQYQSHLLNFAIPIHVQSNNILYINHSMGGGATVYLNNLIEDEKINSNAIVMEIEENNKTVILKTNLSKKILFYEFNGIPAEQFKSLLKLLNVQSLFINELCSYPIPHVIDLILNCGFQYVYFVHDFFSVCPSIILRNNSGEYCFACNDEKKCNECLPLNSYRYFHNSDNDYIQDVKKWRNKFHALLYNAKQVIAPSSDTVKIMKKYYPDIDYTIKEHRVSTAVKNTYNIHFAKATKVRIGVIGAISYTKGSSIVYDLIEKIRENQDNMEIVIIGYTDIENESYISEDGIVTMTGKYSNTKISDILAEYRISFAIVPSLWPETFSYTTSEAILSGYPVMAFDIGAPAERIKRDDCGWCIKELNSESVYRKCLELVSNRAEIIDKAKKCVYVIETNINS